MKNIYNILHVADLHGTPKDPFGFFNHQLSPFLDFVQASKKHLDVIVFSGDLFKKRYASDSPEIEVMLNFFKQLMQIVEYTDIKVVMFTGTYSHDGDQLKLFETLVPFTNLNIFYEPTECEIVPGLLARFIPESYIEDYNEWSSKVFTTPTHVTFFHGLIEGALTIAEKRTDIINSRNSAVIKIDDILANTAICTTGGHIHERTILKNNIWYAGSFSANSFDDADSQKGYDLITIDTSTNGFSVKFIENTGADKYSIIDGTQMFRDLSLETLKNRFNQMKSTKKPYQHVRIDVDVSNLPQLNIDNVNIIKGIYKMYSFKITRNSNPLDVDRKREIEENENFALSKNMTIEDKVRISLKSKYGVDMSLTEIREIMDIPTLIVE
ncbi:MAG: metallophosphoesterase family protein [Peptostreptococcaceae bacterium]